MSADTTTTEGPPVAERNPDRGEGPPPTTIAPYVGPINDPAIVPGGGYEDMAPEACIQYVSGGADLPEGSYVEFGYGSTDPSITGSTRWGLFPCAPIEVVETGVAVPPPPTRSLPATGSTETAQIGVVGAVVLVLGALAVRMAR